MTDFQDLKDRPDAFSVPHRTYIRRVYRTITSFSCCFLEYMQTHTLDGKPRKNRRYKPYKNSRFASHEDMLLFILIYLRDAPKQVLLGALFGMPQPLANKWIHLLLPILNKH